MHMVVAMEVDQEGVASFKEDVHLIISAWKNEDTYYIHPTKLMIKSSSDQSFTASSITCVDNSAIALAQREIFQGKIFDSNTHHFVTVNARG